MKRLWIVIILLMGLCAGCHYMGVTGGFGGRHDGHGISVEIGQQHDLFETEWMTTGGITYINSGAREWIIISPNDPYIAVPGDKRGDEWGFFAKSGPKLMSDVDLYILGIVGMTWTKYDLLDGDEETE